MRYPSHKKKKLNSITNQLNQKYKSTALIWSFVIHAIFEATFLRYGCFKELKHILKFKKFCGKCGKITLIISLTPPAI